MLQSTADALARQARDEERALKQLQQEQALRKQRERARLEGERDQLQRKKRHLQVDDEDVQKSRREHDERIRADGRPLFDQKETLTAKRDTVAVRPERLARLLADQAALDDDLTHVNEQIGALTASYADEKARLDREAGDVEARKRAMEQEEAAHAKAELALDGVVRTMNAAEASKLKDVEELRRMHQLAVRR